MSSEVDICNLALGLLGDVANVASISPPEGSAQASHCATFYPIARDALVEMHDWAFATRRVVLPLLTNDSTQWAYKYAAPNDMVNTISVLDSFGEDDASVATTFDIGAWSQPVTMGGVYTPQPFKLESDPDGSPVIYTNQENAMLRYVARVTDTTKFSPLFVRTLAASLASMLAGPLLKGEAGTKAAAQWEFVAFGRDGKSGLFGKAASSDAAQQHFTTRDRQAVSWINAR